MADLSGGTVQVMMPRNCLKQELKWVSNSFPNYYRTERNTFRLFRLINVDACFIVGRINRTFKMFVVLVCTDEQSLNQLNHTLLHLDLAGRHDAKPSHEELRDWLRSGQVDVVRVK
jgi:hypothetical protein